MGGFPQRKPCGSVSVHSMNNAAACSQLNGGLRLYPPSLSVFHSLSLGKNSLEPLNVSYAYI